MADYIKREDLIERLNRNLRACNPGTFSEICYADAIETVINFPAADVEPVRPCAEVVEDPRTYPGESRANYGCTACRRILGTWKKGLTFEQLPNFCCWCGAEFTDGGTENEL